MARQFDFDRSLYEELLKSVAAMTLLFSDGPNAYIDYRFVEKLFVRSTRGRDISRADKVFDAIVGEDQNIGVGVKTFVVSGASRSSLEKIQEFTKFSGGGGFDNLQKSEIAITASEYRNNTVLADSKEFGINLNKSIYHCLIRSGNLGIIHEEPYPLIDIKNIEPIDIRGNTLPEYPEGNKGIRFTDGVNTYSYSKSKSVLMKVFDLQTHTNFEPIPLEIDQSIWDKIATLQLDTLSRETVSTLSKLAQSQYKSEDMVPGVDYVVLPLYTSMESGERIVHEKSGINQWNAGGRDRKYGEAYIPIPSKIHTLAPGFFPERDKPFDLILPNSDLPINAKVCQANSKALMSNPNDLLCRWLYKVIDFNFSDDDFNRPPNRQPFTYKDLAKVGRDSVKIIKNISGIHTRYEMRFSELNSYEEFLELFNERVEN
jgi:hypothetical protein